MEEVSSVYTTEYKLLCNPHKTLIGKTQFEATVKSDFDYFHYKCDGKDDSGWGCGYRTLQTICSWLKYLGKDSEKLPAGIPQIGEIQAALVEMNDKPETFMNSREWIGSFEVCICLDFFYDVTCRIVHVKAGKDNFFDGLQVLWSHFQHYGAPVMMGGDKDAASKCILGIRGTTEKDTALLILDPHCVDVPMTESSLIKKKWLSWKTLRSFNDSSFYNLCLPLHSAVDDSDSDEED